MAHPLASRTLAYPSSMTESKKRSWVNINRAPVLTLWATVVAERFGFD